METNNIIPGKNIGAYQIGCSYNDLINHFNSNYKQTALTTTFLIEYQNYRFRIRKSDNKVVQISVLNTFNGKLDNKIGIGSTLKDIEKYYGKWEEDLDVYVIPQYNGLCFEIKDIDDFEDDWIEDQMPITVISVYEPDYNKQ